MDEGSTFCGKWPPILLRPSLREVSLLSRQAIPVPGASRGPAPNRPAGGDDRGAGRFRRPAGRRREQGNSPPRPARPESTLARSSRRGQGSRRGAPDRGQPSAPVRVAVELEPAGSPRAATSPRSAGSPAFERHGVAPGVHRARHLPLAVPVAGRTGAAARVDDELQFVRRVPRVGYGHAPLDLEPPRIARASMFRGTRPVAIPPTPAAVLCWLREHGHEVDRRDRDRDRGGRPDDRCGSGCPDGLVDRGRERSDRRRARRAAGFPHRGKRADGRPRHPPSQRRDRLRQGRPETPPHRTLRPADAGTIVE